MRNLIIISFLLIGSIGLYFLSCRKVNPEPNENIFSVFLTDEVAQQFKDDSVHTILLKIRKSVAPPNGDYMYIDLNNFNSSEQCGNGVWNYKESGYYSYNIALTAYAINKDNDTGFLQNISPISYHLGAPDEKEGCTHRYIFYDSNPYYGDTPHLDD